MPSDQKTSAQLLQNIPNAFLSQTKMPRDRFRPGAQKKRHGPESPAHGVGNSAYYILSAADRRRDWLPGGGGRCSIMDKFFIIHGSHQTCISII
jgi:hypothetical protein